MKAAWLRRTGTVWLLASVLPVAAQNIAPFEPAPAPAKPQPINSPSTVTPVTNANQGLTGFIASNRVDSAPARPLPVYNNPSVVVRSSPQPPGRPVEINRTETGSSSDLLRHLPVNTPLPSALGQSRAYYYMTHPKEAASTNAPAPAPGGQLGMLGGRVLSTGQDDITVTLLRVPRFYDMEVSLISPETRLLGTNFNAGKVINLGKLPAGEIVFAVKVNSTELVYPTGPGLRNPDGFPHAVVQTGGTAEAPLVFVGFEDLLTSQTLTRAFNDTVLQLSGGVAQAIAPETPPAAPTATPPAPKKKR